MPIDQERIGGVSPKVRRRACGGWIAVSPRGTGLSLGVTAYTKEEALERFGFVLARWLAILDAGKLDVPKET